MTSLVLELDASAALLAELRATHTPNFLTARTTPMEPEIIAPHDVLIAAADAIGDRATLRDQPGGERSMARAVASFNQMFGTKLTELQGWQFMVLLKIARSAAGRVHVDDFTDAASYVALAAECAQRKPYAPA